ncbi:MAG TPA: glycoside hydrolase family 52 protein [Clostridiaceae bacterium]
MENILFNAHHSPIGAFSSFTLGFPGAKGGLGLGLTKPADTNVYIGIENTDSKFDVFPFYETGEDERKRYDLESSDKEVEALLIPIPKSKIEREFEACIDKFKSSDLDLSIYSQIRSIPDPKTSSVDELKIALLPAIIAELTIDNLNGTKSRKGFLGYDGSDPYFSMRHMKTKAIVGIGQGPNTAIVSSMGTAKSAIGFSAEAILGETLEENLSCGLGNTGLLIVEVLPGQKLTFRFAICFFRDGQATCGIDTHYYYTKLFKNIDEVGRFALDNFQLLKETCIAYDEDLKASKLSEDQRFMLSHSLRSYYGCSELLTDGKDPIWLINEGEYRMLNTLDLTVDQLFFEMKMNPWTVKNVLDMFLNRYSYYDMVSFPGDNNLYEGGLTFTHDMGVGNIFSPKGYSSYERSGIDGCFSQMSHEQLVNWLSCSLVYINQSKDEHYLNTRISTLIECFKSMQNRDNPDSNRRNGIMSLDSSRTKGGAEITTYDSLDTSLGQSRNNIYMAGKCWASYLGLEKLFASLGLLDLSKEAGEAAVMCAFTITQNLTEEGFIPAVIGENVDSRIIPAIEGLIFPYFNGTMEALSSDGKYKDYLEALKTHFNTILVKGTCLFEDGGWKLSSTSNNSWLSKIYLCQFIARKILGIDSDDITKNADKAHVTWLTDKDYSYWSWSDQILSGVITGSKYYPRGVTSILWLEE